MHLKRFFQIPSEIRAEFWQDTLRKNHLSLQVICIIIFAMESLNMFRVLFRSSSGLGTLNNRIYFTMYLLLWMSAAIYLFLWRLLRRCSPRRRWFAQYGTVLFALLWHAGLNAYDLMRNSDAEITVIVTSMLAISVFIQMPIAHSIVAYGLSYGLFMGLAGGLLSGGRLVNLTITTIVSMAVSMTSFRHAVVTVSQHKKIDQMNQKLQELVQKDPLTGLMNTAAFRSRVESYLASASADSETLLLILDLDDFKGINDGFGHPCGDYVLQETAIKLRALFPDAIGAARIGGDEFMLALTDTSPEEVERSFSQFALEMEQLSWRGQALSAGCSIGACKVSYTGITYDELYDAADRALYQAKSLGKGRFICHELATPCSTGLQMQKDGEAPHKQSLSV